MKLTTRWILLLLSIASLALVACEEKENPELRYRAENEQYFRDYEKNKEYEARGIDGINAKVYMKWLRHGKGTVKPIQTSRVLCHYSISLLSDTADVIYSNFSKLQPERLTLYRKTTKTQSVTRGQAIALQNMVVGDECLVAIPWYLGYANQAQNLVKSYSALFFHVKLEGIIPEEEP